MYDEVKKAGYKEYYDRVSNPAADVRACNEYGDSTPQRSEEFEYWNWYSNGGLLSYARRTYANLSYYERFFQVTKGSLRVRWRGHPKETAVRPWPWWLRSAAVLLRLRWRCLGSSRGTRVIR